ncbi:hypothetical protein V499_03041 [Pseudogymnoascus sp. VKM F-103]|nr:hypothetical protein V499_03041 [Pseudogymnoascus sp. VKM F-103]
MPSTDPRPPPAGASLKAKQDFAVGLIKDEQDDMDRRGWDVIMSEACFGELPRTDISRYLHTGEILCGMVIRGRLQSAVFGTFMDLCLQGVCSLNALEHPVHYNNGNRDSDCHRWIMRMLGVFNCFNADMQLVQGGWYMEVENRWIQYDAHSTWLVTMIERSFTSLDAVFNIIRAKGRLGPVNASRLKELEGKYPPYPTWKADININRTKGWHGSGTFAFWLPENIDPAITKLGVYDGIMALSKDFHRHLSRTEMHYAEFFDINRDEKYVEDVNRKIKGPN